MSVPTQTTESSEASTRRARRARRASKPALIVTLLALAGTGFAVLQSSVAPALSAIASDLGTDTSAASWMLTAFLLSASVLTPILGRLGDMIGKRRVLLIVLALLAAGIAVSALATSLPILIVGRALQGAAGAILPLSIGIVRDELPEERVGVTVGGLSAVSGIGAGIGIVTAGPIVEHLSWHWLFWIPLAVVILALIGTAIWIPESPVMKPGRLDFGGTALLAISLVSLLLAISKGSDWGWTSAMTLGLAGLGIVVMAIFALVELRTKEPLIDMRLLARRGVWTTNVVGLAVGFGMFGSFLLVPALLELPSELGYGFGKTITEAGLFLLPTTVMMLLFGPLSGTLAKRYGPRLPLSIGAVITAAAFALPAIGHGAMWQIVASNLLTGIGFALALAAMSNAIIDSVPPEQTGEATSVNSIVRTIGGSVGTAVIAAIVTSNSNDMGIPSDHAFTLGFWVCAGVAVIGIVAALLLPKKMRLVEHDPADILAA
ncbi:MFS transporter [Demequina sp. NBRC 110054]|uniref:MFS transporter n=1 Tax=Demequina sp. NBRC 110054 TaxID=1570343 RepID=UPI000A076723|nr:MFS transporter [Demequina sp. NBRC 110054]